MTDLAALGQELRKRRKALRVARAELARRIEVSPTYIWLIENARPRPSGEPSRPSEDLLERWTSALGMDRAESRQILDLAGYFESRPSYDAPAMSPPPQASIPMPDHTAVYERPSSLFPGAMKEDAPALFTPPMQALRQWSGAPAGQKNDEPSVGERVDYLLRQAERRGKRGEAEGLIGSFLKWLEFHLKDREK